MILLFLCICSLSGCHQPPVELTVSAAASLIGSSPLQTQIEQGAPVDVFASAGLILASTRGRGELAPH